MEPQTAQTSPLPAQPGGAVLAAALVVAALAAALAAVRYAPPAPAAQDAPAESFSATRARDYLEGLLGPDQAPRPVGSEANARARRWLLAALREQGYAPSLQEAFSFDPKSGVCAEVRNVLAELPGAEPDLPALLLVAHYDSVGAGPGAGDDGAGVASLLEMARALKARAEPLRRSVLFLFSDGEEAGLLGARAFAGIPGDDGATWLVPQHPWMRRVGQVINLEARGASGPALMFQVGRGSDRQVQAFAANAPRPVLGSGFATIYDRMPNDTDFTPFKQRGLPGLNLAFVGGVAHYHAATDDLAHLSLASVQHMGGNALPTVIALASEPEASSAGGELDDFDVLAAWVPRWPRSLTPTLAGVALALVLLNAALLARGRRAWALRGLAWGAGGAGLALVGSLLLTHLGARWFYPEAAWPAEPEALLTLLGGLALVAVCVTAHVAERAGFWGAWSGVWLLWALAGVALAFALPGFAYLFFVPALVAGLAGLPAGFGRRACPWRSALAGLLPFAVAAALFAPLLLLLYQALGLGVVARAVVPVAAVGALSSVLLLPFLCGRGAGRTGLLISALGLVLVAGIAATRSTSYATAADVARRGGGEETLVRLDLAFHQHQDPDVGPDAQWLAFPLRARDAFGRDREPPPPPFLLSAPRAFGGLELPLQALHRPGFRAQARPLPGGAPPALEELESEPHGDARMVRFRLLSPRSAPILALILPEPGAKWVKVAGHPLPTKEHPGAEPRRRTQVWVHGAPPEGVRFELLLEGSANPGLDATVLDATRGLPPAGAVLLELRRGRGTPTSQLGDLTVQSARVRF
ncbi:MAG: M20/M25/M40 family metallo-hydrolase [Planctomycetota bacterium]